MFTLGISTEKLCRGHFECLTLNETNLEQVGPMVAHKAALNMLALPGRAEQLPSHTALSRLSSWLCLCQCNCTPPGNPSPAFRPSFWCLGTLRSPPSHIHSQVPISSLLHICLVFLFWNTSSIPLKKLNPCMILGTADFQGLLLMENTGKITAALVSYSTAVLSSSRLSESQYHRRVKVGRDLMG